MNREPIAPEELKQRALMTARVIWVGLLLGELMFLGLILFLLQSGQLGPLVNSRTSRTLFITCLAFTAVWLPAGYIVRSQIYKRSWEGNAIKPAGYFTGNMIFWACCESVAMFSLVTVMMSLRFWPFILPAVIAMLIQVINYPHGRPMEPDEFAPHE